VVGFNFSIKPLKVMQHKGIVYVAGTALTLDEALDLERECEHAGYVYTRPFVN